LIAEGKLPNLSTRAIHRLGMAPHGFVADLHKPRGRIAAKGGGVVPGLVERLTDTSHVVRRAAARALWELCGYPERRKALSGSSPTASVG